MTETIARANDLTVAFVHCSNPFCKNCRKKEQTTSWLDGQFDASDGYQESVPPVTAVLDPLDERLLVYDGNVRTNHATRHNRALRILIVSTQQEFNEYLRNHPTLWFGITNFDELLSFMRIYAAYPIDEQPLPEPLKSKVEWKLCEMIEHQQREFFGSDDDG